LAIGLTLWFDEELERRLRDLWRELEALGVRSHLYNGLYRPHVTLSIWETARLSELEADLRRLVASRPRFPLRFTGVGEFDDEETAVFLRPEAECLPELQRTVHELAAPFGVLTSRYYLPDHWIPHCTMAWRVAVEQFQTAREAMRARESLPSGLVTALGVVDTPAEVELERLEFASQFDPPRRLG
jgi:2'-5' RNA ligase